MGRALSRNPDVFLFDEMLSNLDVKLHVETCAKIKDMRQYLRPRRCTSRMIRSRP